MSDQAQPGSTASQSLLDDNGNPKVTRPDSELCPPEKAKRKRFRKRSKKSKAAVKNTSAMVEGTSLEDTLKALVLGQSQEPLDENHRDDEKRDLMSKIESTDARLKDEANSHGQPLLQRNVNWSRTNDAERKPPAAVAPRAEQGYDYSNNQKFYSTPGYEQSVVPQFPYSPYHPASWTQPGFPQSTYTPQTGFQSPLLPQFARHQQRPIATHDASKKSPNARRYLHSDEMRYTLPVPVPSTSYLTQAAATPVHDGKRRRLLIILDLNGTLIFRKHSTSFIKRPNVDRFLEYLFANHKVMVWSSARPQNVKGICDRLLSPIQQKSLAAVWARDTLKLSPTEYESRVQVYKQLSWVWDDAGIQASSSPSGLDGVDEEGGRWSQANTILIDDSSEKARSEPHNLVQIDEFLATEEQKKVDVLGQVIQYLEWVRAHEDVSACARAHPWYFNPNSVGI